MGVLVCREHVFPLVLTSLTVKSYSESTSRLLAQDRDLGSKEACLSSEKHRLKALPEEPSDAPW